MFRFYSCRIDIVECGRQNAKTVFLHSVSKGFGSREKTVARGCVFVRMLQFGRPSCALFAFFKKTYPSHDHEFWTFVVDGSTVVVV